MPDPTKNVRKGATIGVIAGFIAITLANEWIIIPANPEAGENLSKVYIWLFPAVAGFVFLLDLFRVINAGTWIRGFLGGFTGIVSIVSVVILGILTPLVEWIQSLIS